MALQVAGTTVVDNSRRLVNITAIDALTQLTIQDALRYGDNKIVIKDSAGNATFTIYGAS